MKLIKLTYLSLIAALTLSLSANAQSTEKVAVAKKGALTENELKRWSHLDLDKDSIPGMSVDRVYSELLKGKTSTPVIVGIVDSGVDIEHEDLKSVIWTNKKEIPGNKIDDDKNGYVDDIYGWNFLGNSTKENYEYERIIKNKKLVDEATYLKAKAINDKKIEEANQTKFQIELALNGTKKADETLIKLLGKPTYTAEELDAIESKDQEVIQSIAIMKQMLAYGLSVADLKKEIEKELESYIRVQSGENLKTNYRKVVGDNPDDIKDTKYGDNNVMGPDKEEILHGTHVAGIVAQVRNNKIGGDGIANNVQILTVRAVPDGDEYDKDIALGIRYVGETVAKKLAKYYKNIDALRQASLMDLILVDEIGERIAQSVIDFFDNQENQIIVERLKNYGIQLEIVEKFNPNATDKLDGKTFVVSGVFTLFSRDELKQAIEDNGGKVGSSISAKTDYVVAGDNMGPAKLDKANKLNIPIISEEEFQKLIV
jgi:subtilisin family serine protease